MPKAGRLILKIEGKDIPLDVYKERRSSIRISIGKKSLILRVPRVITKALLIEHVEWAKDWVRKQLIKDPNLLDHYYQPDYVNGDLVHIADKSYILRLNEETRKTSSGKLVGHNILQIKLSKELPDVSKQQIITKLIRRLIALDQTPTVAERILELNDKYFQKPIKQVRLKYNTSNWGSCSSSSNINISTRLLCAPKEVQDYVFIHELAHLEELNHSPRFWKLVKDVMPDYKQKEKWLKENSHLCKI
jgi:predicted metal-dependent hydrolase